MRMQRRKVTFGSLLFAIAIGLGVLAVGWYLLSPLFISETVNEAFPTSAPTDTVEATEDLAAQATQAMQRAQDAAPVVMDEAMPEDEMADMVILAQGEFYSVAHEGRGTATIYQLADGSRVLRLEDFEVLNGPNLHVYLTVQDPVANTVGVELPQFYDLGPLKGNVGAQNYAIPADLDLSSYHSVVIWCVPFRVPFIAASLSSA